MWATRDQFGRDGWVTLQCLMVLPVVTGSEGMGVWWYRSDQLSRWGLWVNSGTNPYHLSFLCHFSIHSTKKPSTSPWTQAEVNISWTWTEASQPKNTQPWCKFQRTYISKSLHIGRGFCLAFPNSVSEFCLLLLHFQNMHSENIKLNTCLRPYDSQVRLSFFLEMCGPLEKEREVLLVL